MLDDSLSKSEQRTLQVMTILAIIALVILFFIQRIIFAMILGLILISAQKAYISLKTRQVKKK